MDDLEYAEIQLLGDVEVFGEIGRVDVAMHLDVQRELAEFTELHAQDVVQDALVIDQHPACRIDRTNLHIPVTQLEIIKLNLDTELNRIGAGRELA